MASPLQCGKTVTRLGSTFASGDSPVFGGSQRLNALRQSPSSSTSRGSQLHVFAMAPKNKVNAYDDDWSKQWFGAGIFNEDAENEPVNIVKKLEKKKLLSQVEKAGLLSRAESAGISLSQIEKLGLLSKAEDLGLLSLAENFASSSPAALASLCLPLLVAAIATIVFVPDDSTVLVVTQNVVASFFAVGAGGLFVSSIILSALQEE
ncbi:uncharacterized protein LOC9661553 [Selaginella moellendorffii]|uniref:uncharacterized protein LOC9661553 n=1 Tax=Selaginella moellendorffii TaxID=88036 RepID=UPI000D1C8F77|nr:uncharacterized protein LOC9661553 [Selaginella moellendorffii]|eukprot:XP_002992368.2 uncharacterized protein LOC9661553 [Selaginella moellendorffii]